MVVVDHLRKYAHFVPLRHPYTTLLVEKVFVNQVVHLHGVPISIVSHCDKVFVSVFWQNLFQLQGTILCMSCAD